MHAAELVCGKCGSHRGWLSKQTHDWVLRLVQLYGWPEQPITIRDRMERDAPSIQPDIPGGNRETAMEFEQRDNSATLFKRERKTDKHPHYGGEALIGGTKYNVGLWKKEGAKGTFLSLSFQRADGQQLDASGRRLPLREELNDEIQF